MLDDVRFWTDVAAQRSRRQTCFAIVKDGKKGDYHGCPSSIHYWCITAEQLLLACEWELNNNDTVETQVGDDTTVVLYAESNDPNCLAIY